MKWLSKISIKLVVQNFFISCFIAVSLGFLVYWIWYPFPYWGMQSVSKVFWISVVVQIAIGPLLAAIVVNPKKSGREMLLDISLISVVQLAILIHSVYVLWQGRPVVLAFEVDRIVLVSVAEIDKSLLSQAPDGLRQLPLFGSLSVATRRSKNNKEFFDSIDLSLAGYSPAMRPDRWEPISQQREEMRKKVKPLTALIAYHPAQRYEIEQAAKKARYPVSQLNFLPLTNSKTRDWIILFNSSLEVVGYAPVDGFIS